MAAAGALDTGALPVSAMTGEGVDALLDRLGLLAREATDAQPARTSYVVLRPGRARFTVERDAAGRFQLKGRSVERWVLETDLDDDRQVALLQQRFRKEGITQHLTKLGARRGDEIEIRGRVFEWVPDEEGESSREAGEPEEGPEPMDRERLLSQEDEAWVGSWTSSDRSRPAPAGGAERDAGGLVGPRRAGPRRGVAGGLRTGPRRRSPRGAYDAATAEEETAGYVDRVNAEHAVRARTMPAAAARSLPREARRAAREAFTVPPGCRRARVGVVRGVRGPMHYAKHGHDLPPGPRAHRRTPRSVPCCRKRPTRGSCSPAALDELAGDAPVVAPPGWSAADVAFHMAAWRRSAAVRRGGGPWLDARRGRQIVDELNERFLARGVRSTPDAVRDRLEAARTRLRAALSATVAPSTEAKEWFQANGVEHYEEHVERPAAQRRLTGSAQACG